MINIFQHAGQPQFSSNTYSTSVYENVTIGTELDLNILATSSDDTAITYSITSGSITDFIIDSTSGVISTAQSLDYEAQEVYQFSIGATDQGSRTSATTVTITVLDVNDNPPIFSQSVYSVTVPEDIAIGTVILIIAVTDADSSTNTQISLSITSGNDNGDFLLDSDLLFTGKSLDRETTASYELTVQAMDGGSPPLSSSASVVITVTDVNDNVPEFSQPIYTATLPIDALNEWSFTVTADSGTNAAITYNISSGNEAGIFSIDPESGEIRVVETQFDAESLPTFTLTVQGTDGTFESLVTVIIIVDNSTTISSTIAGLSSTISTGAMSDESTPFGSTASKSLLLYPILPLLVLLLSAMVV